MDSLLKAKFLPFIYILFFCSCSYQLVDSYEEKINILISSENTQLDNLFITLLKENGSFNLNPPTSDDNNIFKIRIESHKLSRYSGASSLDGRTTRVRMEYEFNFSINSSNLKEPLFREFKESSYYIYDDSKLLSMEEEEDLLVREFIRTSQQKLELLLINFKER
tara:strand:+ start:348 stop:842 length:495 start_codon:yes stop_codon:yes gene_type:complete